MVDFLSNWGVASVQTRCQSSNTSHHGVIAAADDNTFSSSFNGIGGEEGQILSFQGILVSEFVVTGLRLGFTSQ